MGKPLKPYETAPNATTARRVTAYRGWDVRTKAGKKCKELLEKF